MIQIIYSLLFITIILTIYFSLKLSNKFFFMNYVFRNTTAFSRAVDWLCCGTRQQQSDELVGQQRRNIGTSSNSVNDRRGSTGESSGGGCLTSRCFKRNASAATSNTSATNRHISSCG